MDKEILNIISNEDEINNLYFIIARSQYLKQHEHRGVLNVLTKFPEEYLNYLKGNISDIPKMKIYYDISNKIFNDHDYTSELKEYNPNSQFLLLLETKNKEWSYSFVIIDKKSAREILYSKTISLSGSEFNPEEHILNTPCAICDMTSKVKLEDMPYEFSTCETCNEKIFIKYIYECTKCCTQYVYTL